MDIVQLEYFIAIVNHHFNLSETAKALYVSEPNLSKFIKKLESDEDLKLFLRTKNRLIGLTPDGQIFLEHAYKVVESFYELKTAIHMNNGKSGRVRVGIPPVTLTILFNSIIPKFILEHPNIDLQIVEAGAYELKKLLLLHELDFVFLIAPNNTTSIEETIVFRDSVCVIWGKNFPLITQPGAFDFKKLDKTKLVLLNDTFMLYHQIVSKFSLLSVKPEVLFYSGSWDLLMSICEKMPVATILPRLITQFYKDSVEFRDLDPIFPWEVTLCTLNGTLQTEAIRYTKDWFIRQIEELSF
jgi:DNA-binding transcriptional LysR family regulator